MLKNKKNTSLSCPIKNIIMEVSFCDWYGNYVKTGKKDNPMGNCRK